MYGEAFDQSWKGNEGNASMGQFAAHWGLFGNRTTPKPAAQNAFLGYRDDAPQI